MYCPHCGDRVDAKDPYCGRCGAPQPVFEPAEAAERILYFFGPFGVSICEGPYSVWKRRHGNITTIELTNRAIRGIAGKRPALSRPRAGSLAFEIPYDSIVSLELRGHPSPISFQEVLTIRYAFSGALRDKSISMFRQELREAYAMLLRFVPRDGAGLPGRDQV